MLDSDSFFDDADAAAALYELAAPDLPPPTSVRREASHDPEIAVWAVHAKGGVVRMKVAGPEAVAARLRRGALLLPSLAARGLRVPEPLRVVDRPGGAGVTVALERRLGTANAAVGWPILGAPGRLAFAEALAGGLLELHADSATGPTSGARSSGALASDALASGARSSGAAASAPLAWRALVSERVRRRIAFLREADVLSRESAGRIEERMLSASAMLPEQLEPSLCHGAFALSTAVLERRVFAGFQDFESACMADRWLDVAGALAALGDPESGPSRRFVEVYTAVAAPPADLASRLDLYGGLVLLRALSVVAAAFPSEARSAAERLTENWISTESPTGPTSDCLSPPA